MLPQFDLVIRDGTVVTASDVTQADIGIAGGKVAAIGPGPTGQKANDAGGRLALPGGVYPHVHLQYPQSPNRVVSSDD